MAEEEGNVKKGGLSFGFAKKKDSKKLIKSIVGEGVQHKEDEPDFVYSLEGKEVKSSKPKNTEPQQLVIPLIKENNWRTPYLEKKVEVDDKRGITRRNTEDLKKDTNDELSEQATKEILEAAALQNQNWEERGQPDPNLSVPLLVRNKVPDGFETDDKLNVELRPDEPLDADYEEIPIDQFGFAMLRGMGWKDGEGIGKNKEVVAPLEATLRPKGLGLGADRSSQKKNGALSDSNVNGKHGDDESFVMKKGAFCLINKGTNKDLYGVIEGMDEDNARVMVKLTLSGKTVTISQYAVDIVSKRDYEKFSKYLNKGKVDKFKEEQERNMKTKSRSRSHERSRSPHNKDKQKKSHRERSRSPHEKRKVRDHSRSPTEKHRNTDRKRDRHSEKDRKRKHKHEQDFSDEEYTSSSNGPEDKKVKKEKVFMSKDFSKRSEILWVRPDIRVRIVDKKFKSGKYYKSKVVIVDVVGPDNCVCRTDEGKVLEGLSQSVLETVIPKNDHAHALIVGGRYRGQIGEVVKRSKEKCEALLQLLSDRDTVLKLGYDDICEYVGNIEDEFNY